MDLQLCYNASEDTFPLPARIKQTYGPFGFPESSDPRRPYIASCLVMGLDGRASFRELRGQTGGKEVSRSAQDRWLMDFLRAHHDAQLMGASTLREEPGPDGRGADYAIDDEELAAYRQETLRLGRQKLLSSPVPERLISTFACLILPAWNLASLPLSREKRLSSCSSRRSDARKNPISSRSVKARASIWPSLSNSSGGSTAFARFSVKAAQLSTASSSRIILSTRISARFHSRSWANPPGRRSRVPPPMVTQVTYPKPLHGFA
jgi:hypothetical protein